MFEKLHLLAFADFDVGDMTFRKPLCQVRDTFGASVSVVKQQLVLFFVKNRITGYVVSHKIIYSKTWYSTPINQL